jgi:hypothetical protein
VARVDNARDRGGGVPGATVVVEQGQGHLSDLDRVEELTTWLVKGT